MAVHVSPRPRRAGPVRLRDLGLCSSRRLSVTAFGGPAAHIALMQRELVEQRGWLTDAEFLDLVGASNAIPGPTSTEVALYTGRRHGGIPGLAVAGLGFIAPAALIVGLLAWVYVRYGTRPAVNDVLDGVKPVVVAVVSVAVFRLGRTAFTSRLLVGIGAAVLVAYLAGLNEPVLLLAASAVAASGAGSGGPRPARAAGGRPGGCWRRRARPGRRRGAAAVRTSAAWRAFRRAGAVRGLGRSGRAWGLAGGGRRADACPASSGPSSRSGRCCSGAGTSCWPSSSGYLRGPGRGGRPGRRRRHRGW